MPDLVQALARQPRLSRFLCHIYQRLQQTRLNLVIGAGISVDAKVPSWSDLLDRLAESFPKLRADLDKHRNTGLSLEYLGQIVYHRHCKPKIRVPSSSMRDTKAKYEWAKLIYEAIYRDVPINTDDIIFNHPYLSSLRDFARRLPLVINFNFDDILADTIGRQIELRIPGNSFSVVWQPPLLERPGYTTIYHVNGVLPRVSLKKRSPQLIFTEDSFADALARSPGVSAEFIFLRFVQNTMLILGHSLSDTSLRNYLRQNREKAPANHHYMVYWLKEPSFLSRKQQDDIFNANIELYNLITIFLTSDEIKGVLDLLNLDQRGFRDELDRMAPDRRSRFHYYIAGPVASGKSTVLEHLRCFSTNEEWTRPPPPEMYLSFQNLTPEESETVDAFVYSELKEKNSRMHASDVGFHFMDRAPLDLYAFSQDDSERKKKTQQLKDLVTRDKPLHAGEIIFITAKGDTLVERNIGRGRLPEESGKADYLTRQSNMLQDIYEPELVLRTDSRPATDIAKHIARHVLLNEYRPIELAPIIERYS